MLLLTVSFSGGSDTETAQVATSAPTANVEPVEIQPTVTSLEQPYVSTLTPPPGDTPSMGALMPLRGRHIDIPTKHQDSRNVIVGGDIIPAFFIRSFWASEAKNPKNASLDVAVPITHTLFDESRLR